MNEEFKKIVDGIKSNNQKSHVYHNDKKYKDKYDAMIKRFFTIEGFTNDVGNFLYKYENGGFGYYDDEPVIKKYSKLKKLSVQNSNINS